MSTLIKGLLIAGAALAINTSIAHAAGRSAGLAASGWHAGNWHGSGFRAGHRGRTLGRGYYYGDGYYGDIVTDDGAANATVQPVYIGPPQPTVPLVAPALGLTCQHSVQTVTVPSEDGGDREIRITRC